MKTYAFYLSGEHDSLPRSESLALLEIYSSSFKEVLFLDQCLIVQASDLDVKALESRLAMAHSIIEVSTICDALLDSLTKAAMQISLPDKCYCIRAYRIKQASLRADETERAIGLQLKKRGFKADLESPELNLKAIITGARVVLGIEVAKPNRSAFEARKPHLRPFFHPGVLMPRLARALVNISRVRSGENLLDPFTGTAGILIEACLMDIRGIGIDIRKMLIKGAKENLEALDSNLIQGDAKLLPFKDGCIDGAVSDIPYGRSAQIRARSKEELIQRCLFELYRILKSNKRLIIVADEPIDSYIEKTGFRIIEYHESFVHKSLVRYIFVCLK
ncbi:MAG: methyltransferase domain-containing protein [Methanotrichaceae archaeon]|nr:methyltransferase domain-containing protein [Methanotrichaceae archaeon]